MLVSFVMRMHLKQRKVYRKAKILLREDCLARILYPWPWFKVKNNRADKSAYNNEGTLYAIPGYCVYQTTGVMKTGEKYCPITQQYQT